MVIGKAFKKGATKLARTAAKGAAEKTGKKLGEAVVEKGTIKFNKYYKRPKTLERQPKTTPNMARTNTLDAVMKLSQFWQTNFKFTSKIFLQ